MTPTVSAVITAHNYGRFLPAALDSLLGQTFTGWEAVIVDDGSTDDTPAVAARYLRDPRIRYHRTDHVGQPAAKNLGVRLTQAPLVAFLDADDVWLPRKLERQLALFADPAVGVVYGRRVLIDEEGFELEGPTPSLHRGPVLPEIFRRNFVCFSSSVVRREVFESAGGFDEKLALAIDYDLWLRVALRWHFDYVDEPVVKYRTGHANLSRRRPERVRTAAFIIRRFLDERGGRQALAPALVRLVLAENCLDMGAAVGGLACGKWFVKALRYQPTHPVAWHALLAFWWPESMRRLVRRALGRRDWQQLRRAESDGARSPALTPS
ncbi:MAG TPA: glycosyltransferase [Gemmataceae bacterium]|nr:glycosyltransferase [Gemmataceae bacterium]